MKDTIEYDASGRLKCEICGKFYHHLGSHLKVHKVLVREYQEEYRIPYCHTLVSEDIKRVQRENAIRRGLNEDIVEFGRKSQIQKGEISRHKKKPTR